MKDRCKFIVAAIVTCVFFVNCDWSADTDLKYFDADLWGRWESNGPSIAGPGGIEIDVTTIKITGYNEKLDPDDEKKRPFKEFTKNAKLEGYSEEGKFIIKDRGNWQPGISYNYYVDAEHNPHIEFEFDGEQEILDYKGELP
jgi:hypothetical protein